MPVVGNFSDIKSSPKQLSLEIFGKRKVVRAQNNILDYFKMIADLVDQWPR